MVTRAYRQFTTNDISDYDIRLFSYLDDLKQLFRANGVRYPFTAHFSERCIFTFLDVFYIYLTWRRRITHLRSAKKYWRSWSYIVLFFHLLVGQSVSRFGFLFFKDRSIFGVITAIYCRFGLFFPFSKAISFFIPLVFDVY